MDHNVRRSWEEFLNPEVTRPRLIAASIYIAGFEVLKEAIVDHIRDFFGMGFDESGDTVDPRYHSDVLARNKSPVYASLGWLKEMNVINDADICVFDCVKACRNTLAHKLFSTLASEGLPPDFEQRFTEMVELLHKVEVWWIVNYEIPINPDYDGRHIDKEEIVPSRLAGIQLLRDIALGDEKRSRFYYEEFRKQSGGGRQGDAPHGFRPPLIAKPLTDTRKEETDMDFTDKQKTKITRMITRGEKMDTIAREIGGNCTWQDIQQFCWESGYMSWQGSKKMISNRLNRFKAAGTQAERERLAKEIDDAVSYLYYCAKEMRSRIVEIEKALKHIF